MLKDKLLGLLNLIPLQKTIIFEASPDLTDSPYYFFKYLVEHYEIQKDFKLVWFIEDNRNIRTSLLGVPITCVNNHSSQKDLKTRIRRLYYNYTAKVIVDSNLYVYKKRPGQIRIFMDHGMPLKEAVEYQSDVGECDLLTLSGELFADIYRKFTNPDCFRIYGLPRDEPMYDLHRENVTEKKILWMPTYRQHRARVGDEHEPANLFPMGIPVIKTPEELRRVNEALREMNMKLMLRLHPAQDTSVLKVSDMSNIVLANNDYLKAHNMMLEDLLADSDAMITDYSSCYYDYLFTERPIALTFEDVVEYQKTTPLIFKDIEHELPGEQLLTTDELIAFFRSVKNGEDPHLQARRDFMKAAGIRKLSSCKLIAEYLMEQLGR